MGAAPGASATLVQSQTMSQSSLSHTMSLYEQLQVTSLLPPCPTAQHRCLFQGWGGDDDPLVGTTTAGAKGDRVRFCFLVGAAGVVAGAASGGDAGGAGRVFPGGHRERRPSDVSGGASGAPGPAPPSAPGPLRPGSRNEDGLGPGAEDGGRGGGRYLPLPHQLPQPRPGAVAWPPRFPHRPAGQRSQGSSVSTGHLSSSK